MQAPFSLRELLLVDHTSAMQITSFKYVALILQKQLFERIWLQMQSQSQDRPLRSSAIVHDRIITSSSFLSSSLTKLTQGLQQCSLSYCIAYHFKPLDAAPAGAARGLFAEKCKIPFKIDTKDEKIGNSSIH